MLVALHHFQVNLCGLPTIDFELETIFNSSSRSNPHASQHPNLHHPEIEFPNFEMIHIVYLVFSFFAFIARSIVNCRKAKRPILNDVESGTMEPANVESGNERWAHSEIGNVESTLGTENPVSEGPTEIGRDDGLDNEVSGDERQSDEGLGDEESADGRSSAEYSSRISSDGELSDEDSVDEGDEGFGRDSNRESTVSYNPELNEIAFETTMHIANDDRWVQLERDFTHITMCVIGSKHASQLNLTSDTFEKELQVSRSHALPEISEHCHEVLDIGYGCGEWASRFAAEYPRIKVVGIDNHIRRFEFAPNVEPQYMDCEDEWTFVAGRFQYIVAHNLTGYIKDWPKLLRNCHTALSPKGWLEIWTVDFEQIQKKIALHHQKGAMGEEEIAENAEGNAVREWAEMYVAAAEKNRTPLCPFQIADNYKGWENLLVDAGFLNVAVVKHLIPVHVDDKLVGNNGFLWLERFMGFVGNHYFEGSSKEAQTYLEISQKAQYEMLKANYQIPFYTIYAGK